MEERAEHSKVKEVFKNTHAHRFIADIVRKHSTNRSDIREIAVGLLDMSECRNILDLGCGFGFFTEILKGRVHPRALVTGVDIIDGYETSFHETCQNAGLECRFLSEGASVINKFDNRSFDLILCSYALYFFPEFIPDISRILTSSGSLVAITHDRNNMRELIAITKEILSSSNILKEKRLPLEAIISSFSAENGEDLLAPWFGKVKTADYFNSLVFGPEDVHRIIEYFLFKSPFLLTGADYELEYVIHLLSIHIQKASFMRDGFTISKNDRVFICSSPRSS